MSLESVLAQGRARSEALRMTSTCTITHEGARDASTLSEGSTTVYSGPCEVADGGVRLVTVGGTQTEQAVKTLKLPVGTTGLSDADLARVDSGDAAGLALRLLEVTPSDHRTALRIQCVEA